MLRDRIATSHAAHGEGVIHTVSPASTRRLVTATDRLPIRPDAVPRSSGELIIVIPHIVGLVSAGPLDRAADNVCLWAVASP